MRWQVLLGLVLCNAIWASVPIVGKFILEVYAPMEAALLRYSGAFLTLAILSVPGFAKNISALPTQAKRILSLRFLPWFLLVGSTTFFLSPLAQYWGLAKSTASANTLVVATEPLITAVMAWILLREKMLSIQWIGFLIAVAGFFLLSNIDPGNFFASFMLFNAANLFYVLTMPCEAIYTVTCRKLAGVALSDKELYGGSIFVGVLALVTLLHFTIGLPDFTKMTKKVFFALLWIGPVGHTITYLYWSKALQEVPVATVALTLFVQPILGTIFGHVFLDEVLTFWQGAGAALILSALGLQTFYDRMKRSIR